MANVLGIISRLADPIVRVIDDLHTSDEEKAEAKRQVKLIQLDAMDSALKYETNLLNRQADVITAEAKGESWMQRNWRPTLMLSIVGIMVNNYILAPWLSWAGVSAPLLDLPPEMWTLMTIGVGGYIGGRSLEKIQKNGSVKGVMKQIMGDKE